MRKILFILLLLLALPLRAQPPRIDSIFIDEDKGELIVKGLFQNSASAIVIVDSVSLPIISASDTLLHAKIPDSGKGSAGRVTVIQNGILSNRKLLSYWHFEIENRTRHAYSDDKDEWTSMIYFLHIRFDLVSANNLDLISIPISLLSKLHTSAGGSDGHPTSGGVDKYIGPKYDTTINLRDIPYYSSVPFSLKKRTFYYDQTNIVLDSNYEVIADYVRNSGCPDICYGGAVSGCCQQWYPIAPTDFQPSRSLALNNQPTIVSPKNNSLNLGTDDVLMDWDSIALMDKYHLQLSTDSIFNEASHRISPQSSNMVLDTIIASLDFTLPPLKKNTRYYWRVAGINEEGQSRWSDIFSFTTGTSASVKDEELITLPSLSNYPNPAINSTTITYSLPSRSNTTLAIYDVMGREIASLASGEQSGATHQIQWDIREVPNGTYLIKLNAGGKNITRLIQVLK